MYNTAELKQARELLGVTEESSIRQIKEAFRSLVISTHPDRNSEAEATEKMQALNHAYEVLIKSENGKKLELDEEKGEMSEQEKELEKLFQFYKFFFERKQPGEKDVISEAKFQTILREIKDNMKEHAGWVYPGYGSLFGISAVQIQRLLVHSAQYGGSDFRLDGHSLRPEVLVCLLRFLSDYTLPNHARCTLNLSNNSFEHPEVSEALAYFLDNAKSQWVLKLDKCNLKLTKELAEHFAVNKTVHTLSIRENHLFERDALGLKDILEKNTSMEEIDFSDNSFNPSTLVFIAQSIPVNQSLRKVSLNISKNLFELPGDVDIKTVPAQILKACLENQYKLEEVTLKDRNFGEAKLELSLPVPIKAINPRIQNLNLEGFAVQPEAIQHLLTHCFPELKRLWLYKCGLSNELLQAIADVINTLPKLEDLWIDSPLGLHEGQAAIFNAASQNKTLKELSLYHYGFAGRSNDVALKLPQPLVAQALEKLFRENKSLTRLNIQACNSFSEASALKMAKACEKYNRTLTKIEMDYYMPHEANAMIIHQVSRNNEALNPKKPTARVVIEPEEEKDEQKEIAFSQEEFYFLANGVREQIVKGDTQLKLKTPKSDGDYVSKSALSRWKDDYVSIQQLQELMDVALTGNFTSIDLSKEHHLPAEHNRVILQKMRKHYTSENPNRSHSQLTELNLASNNLCGQVDELVALISDPESKLEVLNLSNTHMTPEDLVLLANAISVHPTLRDVSLAGCGVKHGYRFGDAVGSAAIAEMLRKNSTIRSIDITCDGLKGSELSNLLSSLGEKYHAPQAESDKPSKLKFFRFNKKSKPAAPVVVPLELPHNTSIECLSLEFDHEQADKQLALVLQTNPSIHKLVMYNRNNSFSGYSDSIIAAMNSPWLKEFVLRRYHLRNMFDENSKVNQQNNSQLSDLSLVSCDVDAHALRALKDLPLKKIDLSSNRFYADIHAAGLLELIDAKRDSLEEINLSGNWLGENQDKKAFGEDSHFLSDLSEVLKSCHSLRTLLLEGDRFSLQETVKFVRNLKIHNSPIEKLTYTSPTNFYDSKRYIGEEVAAYMEFIAAELQLKNTFLANKDRITFDNPSSQMVVHGAINQQPQEEKYSEGKDDVKLSWSRLEKLYQKEISRLLRRIDKRIDIKYNGGGLDRMFGKRPDASNVRWTDEHKAILDLAVKGDYASYHKSLINWKTEHGDTEDQIDIHLSIMLDWLDECLLFYANSIKAFNVQGYAWASVYPDQAVSTAYDNKLDILENDRVQEDLEREQRWANDRNERDAKEKADEAIIKQALIEEKNQLQAIEHSSRKLGRCVVS